MDDRSDQTATSMHMREGQKGSLIFLLTADLDDLYNLSSTIQTLIPDLYCFDYSPTVGDIERCIARRQDAFAFCTSSDGNSLRKAYPDTVVLLSLHNGRDERRIGGYIDYILNPGSIREQLQGVIFAERSRRQVINSKPTRRHRFDYTATALVFNQERTHLLFIPKASYWFPPGGHVEIGEYPHETVIREVLEETGYKVGFLSQPQSIGMQRGATLILSQPYRALLVDLTTYYHDDFLYLSQVLEVLQRDAEFEGKWVVLEQIQEVPLPEDIQDIIAHLREELDRTVLI